MLPNKEDIIDDSFKQLLNWSANVNSKILYYNFIENDHPQSAADLRKNAYLSDMRFIEDNISDTGLVIYERQAIGSFVEGLKRSVGPFKTMYWCPVSATANIEPDFVKGYHDDDIKLAKQANEVLVATKSQAEYFKEKSGANSTIFNKFVDFNVVGYPEIDKTIVDDVVAKANGKKIVFFPFRLSDKGYKFDDVLNSCKSIGNCFIVVTDPNDTLKTFDTEGLDILKVSTDRKTYYSLLASNIAIIPYLEDLTDIWHASINEVEALSNNKACYTIEDFEKALKE